MRKPLYEILDLSDFKEDASTSNGTSGSNSRGGKGGKGGMGAKSAKGTGAKDTGAKGAKGGSSSNVGGENTVDSAHELLQAVAQEIFSSKKCVIVTGAGISASAGIPTFRDKDGFFQTIKKKYQGLHLGTTDIMDYTQCYPNRVNQSVPHKMTILHHNVMMDLKALARTKSPTPFHWFIDFLDSKGILLRHYDQNIDGLIEKLQVFLSFDKVFYKVVQCHGTLTCLQCRKCRSITFDPPKEKEDVLRSGELPTCDEKECSRRSSRLNATLREIGFARLRINVALYRESADHFLGDNAGDVAKNDLREKPDLLLVVGTSLNMEAAGTIKLVSDFCRQNTLKGRGRKRIFLNPEAPPSNISSLFDVWVCGRADDFIERLRRMAPDGFLKGSDEIHLDHFRRFNAPKLDSWQERDRQKFKNQCDSVSRPKRSKHATSFEMNQQNQSSSVTRPDSTSLGELGSVEAGGPSMEQTGNLHAIIRRVDELDRSKADFTNQLEATEGRLEANIQQIREEFTKQFETTEGRLEANVQQIREVFTKQFEMTEGRLEANIQQIQEVFTKQFEATKEGVTKQLEALFAKRVEDDGKFQQLQGAISALAGMQAQLLALINPVGEKAVAATSGRATEPEMDAAVPTITSADLVTATTGTITAASAAAAVTSADPTTGNTTSNPTSSANGECPTEENTDHVREVPLPCSGSSATEVTEVFLPTPLFIEMAELELSSTRRVFVPANCLAMVQDLSREISDITIEAPTDPEEHKIWSAVKQLSIPSRVGKDVIYRGPPEPVMITHHPRWLPLDLLKSASAKDETEEKGKSRKRKVVLIVRKRFKRSKNNPLEEPSSVKSSEDARTTATNLAFSYRAATDLLGTEKYPQRTALEKGKEPLRGHAL